MKYGKYLQDNIREEWKAQYVDYGMLKGLIKQAATDAGPGADPGFAFSPRTTSLTVARASAWKSNAEERFFKALEGQVDKVGKFTAKLVAEQRGRLNALQDRANVLKDDDDLEKERLLQEAKSIGDEFLQLEKYVNLNYMALHKILKKHDKMLPHSPCRQFYTAHLHHQPWVQGTFSDLMVQLSELFSLLRGDQLAEAQGGSAQAFSRSTTKWWIRTADVSAVKRIIIENMPVFVFNPENYSGDAQLVNSVYFDNDSMELYHGRLDKKPGALAIRVRWYGPNDPKLCFIERKIHKESWKGEKSVKERFTLPEAKVVPFITGEYKAEQFEDSLRAKGKGEDDIAKASRLFSEIQTAIDVKQLKPLVRTQYLRSAYQMGHDRTVSFTLDTNLVMLKENPEGHPSCAVSGRWYRDPSLPIHRTEITRFPHAVLEIKLALPPGQEAPAWVKEMMESGLITEVHKMSKFIHGTAVLFPEMVQAVPYWVDDESLRSSILASAPEPKQMSATAKDAVAISLRDSKPRRRSSNDEEPRHPLLGIAPTLALMPPPSGTAVTGADGQKLPRGLPQRLEPKTFMASERTFLSWLHMAITIGSIAAALLAFAANSKEGKDPARQMSNHLVEAIALVLLPLAILMVAYALMVFCWRNSQIAMKQASYIDDRRGPFLLVGMVVTAMSAIFIMACVDLVAISSSGGDSPAPPASAPMNATADHLSLPGIAHVGGGLPLLAANSL